MADPTPPSDIPDPASPTPASPAPSPGPGPKRIRSMPDRPANARPVGTIRSMPESTRATARPAGTYANTLGTEKSWKRGLAILWAIIVAAMLLEMCNAAGFVLAGRPGWPVPIEAGRIALVCTFFAALWAGYGWLRYVAALVSLGSGAWLAFIAAHSYREAPRFWATGESDWTVYTSYETHIKASLAIIYIVRGFYLLFSDDVREFMVHRRARGRIWSALLVTIFSYGCMALIFAAQPIYGYAMQGWYADAQRFGDDTMRMMAQTWDADAILPRLDPAYAKSFPKADREASFVNFRYLGPVKNIEPAPVVPQAPMPQYVLQDKVPIPQGIKSQPNKAGKGLELTATYMPANVEFTHGRGKFGFDLTRELGGPWRVTKLSFETVQYDARPKPAPSPDATPGPGGTNPPTASPGTSPAVSPTVPPVGSPAPSASPGPTTSTATTDAAAPTPAGTATPARTTVPSPTAAPTATVAPPPAASAAPTASPAATTGG